jgi:large subunit ribosomal protein L18
MIKKPDKNAERRQRAKRTSGISGTREKPRLSVYRSLNNIYAQLIDDVAGVTLAAANSLQPAVAKAIEGKTKKEQAFIVGQHLAKAAAKAKITEIVFDRNGYVYTGRVAEVAAGAREGGLKF